MDPEKKELLGLYRVAVKRIGELQLSIKMLTLSHMYVHEKHDIYENMINGIMSNDCLGDKLKDSRIKLDEKMIFLYDDTLSKLTTYSEDDFLEYVDKYASGIIRGINKKLKDIIIKANKDD